MTAQRCRFLFLALLPPFPSPLPAPPIPASRVDGFRLLAPLVTHCRGAGRCSSLGARRGGPRWIGAGRSAGRGGAGRRRRTAPMAEQRVSRWYFGGIASCGAACCTHPLDLLKVRARSRRGGAATGGGRGVRGRGGRGRAPRGAAIRGPREGRGAVPVGPRPGSGCGALGAGRGPTGLRVPGQDVSRALDAWHPRSRSKGPRAAAAASPDPARGGGQVAASPAGLPGAAHPRGTRGSVRTGLPGRAASREPAGRPPFATAEPAELGGRVGLCPALCERAASAPGRSRSRSLPLDRSYGGEAPSRAWGQGRSSVPVDLGPRGAHPTRLQVHGPRLPCAAPAAVPRGELQLPRPSPSCTAGAGLYSPTIPLCIPRCDVPWALTRAQSCAVLRTHSGRG